LVEPALRRHADVPGDVAIAAALLLGMWNEAAAIIAASSNPRAAAKKIQPTLDAFLTRLLGA
jgi:hypothetical protein